MADRTVVVLGGGTGGLVAARRLRRGLDAADRVVLVDRDATFRFAPSFLWVMTGARRAAQITTDRRRLRRAGIEVLQADVLDIDPAHHHVKTSDAEVAFDRLVVARGAEPAPKAEADVVAANIAAELRGHTAAKRFDGTESAIISLARRWRCAMHVWWIACSKLRYGAQPSRHNPPAKSSPRTPLATSKPRAPAPGPRAHGRSLRRRPPRPRTPTASPARRRCASRSHRGRPPARSAALGAGAS